MPLGRRAVHHRRADLRGMKERAVARLSEAGVFTTLTMTASLGVNDDEIGAVVMHALATPYVGGVSIQPQFGSGRSAPIDPLSRLTHTGVLARLSPQTGGVVNWDPLGGQRPVLTLLRSAGLGTAGRDETAHRPSPASGSGGAGTDPMREEPPAVFTRRPPETDRSIDPLRFCVATTVAAIAWLITPPLAVTLFAVLGFGAYWKAYRRGLLRSRCALGDTRLVLAYLAVLAFAGTAATVVHLIR